MTLLGYLRVLRLPLAILGLVASVGLLNWSGQLWTLKAPFIVATVFLANLGWTLANEYMDMETDKINKSWKPLPSGQVNENIVQIMGSLFIFFSWISNVILGFFFNPIYLVGLLAHIPAFIYNCVRKDLFGNVCMAVTYGVAAFLSLYPHNLLFCLPFALFTMAHNLNNQYQDLKAEETVRVVTVPQQLGSQETYWLSQSLLTISFLLFLRIYQDTEYIPLLIFLAVTVTTVISTVSMLIEQKKAYYIIENVARRLGRLLLLIGFLTMLYLAS